MALIRESSFAQYLAESAREEGIEQGIRHSIQEVLALRFDPGVLLRAWAQARSGAKTP